MPETKQKIISAASDLFWKNSYDSVGVDSICKEAGIKKGSFYHFFPSKEALLFEILDIMEVSYYEQIEKECFAPKISSKKKLLNYINLVYQHMVEQYSKEGVICGCPVGNIGSEMSAKNENIRNKISELFEKNADSIMIILNEAKKDGTISKNTNTKKLSRTFLSCFQGSVLLAKTENDPQAFKDSMNTFLKSIILK